MTEPFISPIRPDQIPDAARVMAYAFANAPRYTFLLPDDTRRHAKLPWYWEATIRASIHSDGVVHVAHDAPGSAVLAVAIWGSPERRKHSILTLLRSGLWTAPVRLGIPAWRRRRALGPLLDSLGPPNPCWHLNSIGVDPSTQRAGMGTALLSTTCSRASMTTPCPRSWIRPSRTTSATMSVSVSGLRRSRRCRTAHRYGA